MFAQSLRRNAAVSSWLIAAAILALGGAPTAVDARAIYKCTLADGKTVFSDTPCKETSSQQELQMRGGTAVPSGAAAAAEARPAAAAAEPGTCPWTPPEGEVRVDQPRKIDPEQLPHDASGKPVEIFVGKRGPMSVAGTCSAMVSACSQKSDDPAKAMDACFKSAPHCATEQPWDEEQACCPRTCWEKYADLRHHCVDASSASYKALFEAHCVPGTANVQAQARP